ncbi:hypothetical protein [Haladaptatus sp.]|uniref:hypothetical protein n=1 Tax=Haladaptatus sp. TaxID=1973141 RepID=UPI003C67A3F1
MSFPVRPTIAIVGVFVAAVAIGGIWTRRSHWSREKQWSLTFVFAISALMMVRYSGYDWGFPEWVRTGLYLTQGVLVVLILAFFWMDSKA